MLRCIFLLSDSEEVMLEKQPTGHRVDRSIVLGIGITLFLKCHHSWASRVADILSDYLGKLNEDVVKDNFVIVYQLLDEMIDNGFPLTTEPTISEGNDSSSQHCQQSSGSRLMSGLLIDRLDFKNPPSRPYKGFRAQTQAGHCEVR
ncbi:hypothetical protein MLD38_039790 [Melastoma candidum]|uniref:Uncharacterized protein n=1 Tax=Melastoma candidum TaxID=119954 RepID=A0ACB9L382_9MYRT|nr:hypothetical protein MLD38_039790 [Melastoma candidum]